MAMTDPIADMLTRIRNANTAYHKEVIIPASKMKKNLIEIFKNEGYIEDFEVIGDAPKENLRITLKYKGRERVISGLRKISKPGLKVYADKNSLPRVLGGLGVAIVSTSKGIITDKEARKQNIGGEVVCYIW